MKKILLVSIAAFTGLISAEAYSAAGEYWEVTTKMEMPGMPMEMPAQTVKVCMPKGGERDPQRIQGQDSSCQMTDVKAVGNKTSWKAKCVNNGETMNGTGEAVYERDSYHGSMHMTGQTDGQAFDMKNTYSGRRVGGSCNTGAVKR